MQDISKILNESLNPTGLVEWKSNSTQGLSLDQRTGGDGLHEFFESVLRYHRKPVTFTFKSGALNQEFEVLVGPIKKDGRNSDWIPFTEAATGCSAKLSRDDTYKTGKNSDAEIAIRSHKPEEIIRDAASSDPHFPKIFRKVYFQVALFAPLSLALVVFLITCFSKSLSFDMTISGIDYFIKTFSLTFKILGLGALSIGVAATFYRLELSHFQNERLIVNQDEAKYQQFRSEFLSLLSEEDYEFRSLRVSPSVIFSSLYHRAPNGSIVLTTKFDEMISDDHPSDFVNVMDSLNKSCSASSPEKYFCKTYNGVYELYYQLSQVIPIDADVNFAYHEASFRGKYSECIIGVLSDIFHIVSVVNIVHGGAYFANGRRRGWRKLIEQLPEYASTAEQIVQSLEISGWFDRLYANDAVGLKNIHVREYLRLCNNNACDSKSARLFIIELTQVVPMVIKDEILAVARAELNLSA